jgi:hypothetical protein
MKYTISKLSKQSNENINYIFENYSKQLKFNIKDPYFIKLLYKLIKSASATPTPHTITHDTNVKVDKIQNDKFISKEIVDFLQISTFTHYYIQFKIKEAFYHIHIYSQNDININKYLYFIKLILNICSQHATTRYNVFTFKIILTEFNKTQPTIPIQPSSINSGMTEYPSIPHPDDHKEITIFRKEEWFKVFIHECFHLFCLDFAGNDSEYKQLFKPLFNIESDFLFFESLCEFWARTINIAIISYSTKKNIVYEEFASCMEVNLQIEKIYSLLQMKYILSNMGFTYESLMDKNRTLPYVEDTNMFCYYVLTPVLLFHYEETMQWFIENNQTLLQFKKNKQNIHLFFYYIKRIYNNPSFISMINSLSQYKLTNNCMSSFEILI